MCRHLGSDADEACADFHLAGMTNLDHGTDDHIWLAITGFRVREPNLPYVASMRDMTHPLTIPGVSCVICHEDYAPEVDAKPCPGAVAVYKMFIGT